MKITCKKCFIFSLLKLNFFDLRIYLKRKRNKEKEKERVKAATCYMSLAECIWQ